MLRRLLLRRLQLRRMRLRRILLKIFLGALCGVESDGEFMVSCDLAIVT